MYRMIIVTALGNYVVEMVPEKEEPTADELMKMFLETKADVESGCFMEGWTPTDGLSGAPGVFAIGKGLEILAYHVERRPEFDLPPINSDTVNTRRPLSIKFNYLGNEMTAKCIQDDIGSVAVIFCYAVNGGAHKIQGIGAGFVPDVLNTKKLSEILCSRIRHHLNYADDEYLLQIAEDGIIRNYSQAEEVVKQLEDQFNTLHSNKTGKAWNGWKGES